jgi:hypothetical protein
VTQLRKRCWRNSGVVITPIVPQEPTFASSAILRSIFTSHLTSTKLPFRAASELEHGGLAAPCSVGRTVHVPIGVQNEIPDWSGPVASASKFVHSCLLPAPARLGLQFKGHTAAVVTTLSRSAIVSAP